jgi:DNA polymerase-3 subunit epsilon
MSWFKNIFKSKTEDPEFWQNYLAEFKHPSTHRVVVLDCETTGLKPGEDKILSIGAVALHHHVIHVEDHFTVEVKQQINNPESVAIHGIIESNTHQKISEFEALKQLLHFLGSAKIIGHHIQFDIQMINIALQNAQLPKLKNRVQDTNDLYSRYKGVDQSMHKSLDQLCEEFNIPTKDRHTALGDAFLTAQVYQRLVSA